MTETLVTDHQAFNDWLTAGTTPLCVYHRGYSVADSHDARFTCRVAWKAAVDRKVYLLQRRTAANGVFEYIAIRAEQQVPLLFAPAY